MKKNKKTASCLYENSNISLDPVHNTSIDSLQKESNNKTVNNLNVSSNMQRKLKLPTNNFWKKFIGKTNNTLLKHQTKDEKEQNRGFRQNENNENEWMKRELLNLKSRVEVLEKSEKVTKETTEKLERKYRKLKKEKECLKKMNNYLIDQNKGILLDLKEVSSKTSNKSFETVLKSLNEFEVKLKNSIMSSNKFIS